MPISFEDVGQENLEKVRRLYASDTSGFLAAPTDEWLAYKESSPDVHGFLVRSDGEAVASLIVEKTEPETYAVALFIREERRGQSLASRIFEHFLTTRPDDMRVIKACIEPCNIACMNLYKKLGFRSLDEHDEDGNLLCEYRTMP